ncbi:DNA topoisomerase IB [Pedobacter glucosidilyticus]|uniref:DNA topoisomerase IB n=1 Tax=Pedobacter glucosidilyticus TaxID=1122941 RepID=UPI00042426B5|nr:DNA topoisomerase IB [Pedobacter glucosidilyticus]
MNKQQKILAKIGLDPKITAKAIGLRYINNQQAGYNRFKTKSGFLYKDEDGKKVTDKKLLERFKKLVIPPAYEHVWISPSENTHLQFTGIDAKGRKQYRYHPEWNKIRNEAKFYRLRKFAEALPHIRKQVETDLNRKGLPFEKVLALVVKLIELTHIRIGNAEYSKLYGSFGLTTLRDKHVKFTGNKVNFIFKGKKGVQHNINLQSRKLATLVKRCKDIPGKELFQYYDDEGKHYRVESGDVNQYLKSITGEDFTAKDFRTWAGSVHALCTLKQMEKADQEQICKKNIVQAIDEVARKLGNTRTVCKKYYIHPIVFHSYEKGTLYQYDIDEDLEDSLLPEEKLLVKILDSENMSVLS